MPDEAIQAKRRAKIKSFCYINNIISLLIFRWDHDCNSDFSMSDSKATAP